MANSIEAIPVQPAQNIDELQPETSISSMVPSTSAEIAQQAKGDYFYESLFFYCDCYAGGRIFHLLCFR